MLFCSKPVSVPPPELPEQAAGGMLVFAALWNAVPTELVQAQG